MVNCSFLPRIRIDVRFAFLVGGNLVVPIRAAGRIDHAGIVSAVGQHEGDIGVRQHLNFVNRPPWRDVIGAGADGKYGDMNVAQ